jgi:hypothetical protein
MLYEPASSLTDLLLGMVVLALAVRLRGVPGVHRYWRLMFWWIGAAAIAGAAHHGVVKRWEEWAEPSWAVISMMVVIGISYLLAATVAEVLGPGRGRVFWSLRTASLAAYAVLALTGHAGIEAILLCEGVTMIAVLALWGYAASRGHELAIAVSVALAASALAGATRATPPEVTALVGLDPTSLYHVAQIPGMAMLFFTLTDPSALTRLVRSVRLPVRRRRPA